MVRCSGSLAGTAGTGCVIAGLVSGSGGGVTAGIDLALTVAAELAGPDVAQAIQLGIEYAPAPPFNSGRPELAPPQILDLVQRRMSTAAQQRRDAVRAAADRLVPRCEN